MPAALATDFDDALLLDFLQPQIRDYGGNVEIDDGLWTVFAVPATDSLANALARSLLAGATFAYESGASADDQWTLCYVDTAHREAARHWLNELAAVLAGEIRPTSPAQRTLVEEVIVSAKPHRAAPG
jgi:hypothetical protein